ncbi:MAG: HEAT repeat domain-containing protein [Anaerolineae bacterium]
MMNQTPITGREPRLSNTFARQHGQRRLSLRGLATMFNVLPPEAISLDAAAAALRNDEFFVRYNAAKMLGRRGDRDARMVLQDAITTGEVPTRASAARHLYGFSWYSAEPLIKQALQDKDAPVREAAVYALCDLRELSAYQLMVEALQNEEDSVREAAAWGLRDCQDPAAVPVLKAVLEAKDPDVRVKALEALGQNDTPQAMPVVRQAMNDPDPDVKYAATLSLLELAGETWLEELSGVIGRTSGVTLQQVLRGFFHATNYLKIDVSKSKAADLMIDALETAVMDTAAEARMAVIWPLAWMRHARMPGILKRAYMMETDSEVKAHIVRVAASLMSPVGEEILQDALKSRDATVCAAAEKIMQERAQHIQKTV